MKINYLELRNYRKFERVELEMPDGIIGIIGKNGVGKSTLIESIAWAMFGNETEIVREKKESIRRAGAGPNEPTRVVVQFSYANDEYSVTREMYGTKHTVDAVLEVNGKQIAKGAEEVTREIEKKIGMDYKSFFISVFARQKELAALSALSESERKAMIMRMLRIDRLDDVISNISREEKQQRKMIEYRRKELIDDEGRPKIASLARQKETLLERIGENEKRIRPLEEKIRELRDSEARLEASIRQLESKLKQLNDERNAFEKIRTSLKAKRDSLEEMNIRLNRARLAAGNAKELDVVELELKNTKQELDVQMAAKRDNERLDALRKEIRQIESRLEHAEDEISAYEASLCKLRQELEEFEPTKELERAIQSELEDLKEKTSTAKEARKALEREIQKNKKHLEEIKSLGPDSRCPTCDRILGEHYGNLMNKLRESVLRGEEELSKLSNAISSMENEIQRKKDALMTVRERLESLRGLKEELAAFEKAREQRMDERAELSKRLEEKRSEARELEKVLFDEEKLNALIKKLEGLEQRQRQLLRDSALARELPELEQKSQMLSAEIAVLEKEMSEISFDQEEMERLESMREKLDRERREIRERHESVSKELVGLKERRAGDNKEMENLEREISRLKESENELKRLEEEQAYLSKLEEIMKDFKGKLIARIVPTLSMYASDLMSRMTDGKYSNLLLDDNYNISIEDYGKVYGVKRYSGGETDLANLSLRLAISRVIAETSYTEGVNLLVLDEIFGSLDAEHKQLVLTAFDNLSRQFRQIILITHIEDIKDRLGTLLEVYEDERGVSHVRMAA